MDVTVIVFALFQARLQLGRARQPVGHGGQEAGRRQSLLVGQIQTG